MVKDHDHEHHHLPESISHKVSECWKMLSSEETLRRVSEDSFIRMFEERPDLLTLFGYEGLFDTILAPGEKRELPAFLKSHAFHVIRTIGQIASGETTLERVVPYLRSIGEKHELVGVLESHYEIINRNMMQVISEELEDYWDEEMHAAWDLTFHSISSIVKNPHKLVQLEPIRGWGMLQTIVCAFVFFYTPFRMGAFVGKYGFAEHTFTLLTRLSLVFLSIDMVSHKISNWLRVTPKNKTFRRQRKTLTVAIRTFFERVTRPIRFRIRRFFLGLQMELWSSWPLMDFAILVSYPLQYMYRYIFPDMYVADDPTLPPAGVHWSYAFGLIRLVAVRRVFHSWNCWENNLMLTKRFKQQDLLILQLVKLSVLVGIFVHIGACLWCLVARIELGAGGTIQSTPFFPNGDFFLGRAGTLNSYLHALHWSWVNLSGIGDVDSSPVTSLECFVILFTHICGATLYTIATGNVVAMLEKMTAERNKAGEDLAELGEFMMKCEVSKDDQQRILQGYLMNQLISDPSMADSNEPAQILPDAAERLPHYLKNQLSYYSRSKAIRSRDPAFFYCSQEFIFALIGTLQNTTLLLAGDYLVKEGDALRQEFIFVAEGSLEVMLNNRCVRMLQRGDVIGKRWLLDASGEEKSVSYDVSTSIRAMTSVKLLSGLSDVKVVQDLHSRYRKDFLALKEGRDRINRSRKSKDEHVVQQSSVRSLGSLTASSMSSFD